MLELARAFNALIVSLVNGGAAAANEALHSMRNDWPLLVFEGSGRFADELSAAMRNPTLDTSAAIREIARSGHAKLFSIDEPSAELRKQLQQILSAG